MALGGDCLAGIAVLREQSALAEPVASDPVVSRLVSALAAELPWALKAIRVARAAARERAWALAGDAAPGSGDGPVVIDLDATIVIAQSLGAGRADREENLRPVPPDDRLGRPRRGRERGAAGHRAPPGNAGSNTAADHIEAARLAVAQRGAKDTGLRNLPLKGFAQNQLWCEIVALAGGVSMAASAASAHAGTSAASINCPPPNPSVTAMISDC